MFAKDVYKRQVHHRPGDALLHLCAHGEDRLQQPPGTAETPVAKAAYWTVTDTEARKRGEQTGLDTLVVHAVNDEY